MTEAASEAAPLLQVAMLGPALLLSGVVLFWVGRFLARNRMLPIGDPLLDEWRNFHL